MNIKRYVVRNMKEALTLIKRDLGPDAIIVSSHKIREKGIRGWFMPPKLEVIAVLEKAEEDAVKAELGYIHNLLTRFSQPIAGPENEKSDIDYSSEPNAIKQSLINLEIDEHIADILVKDLKLSWSKEKIKQEIEARLISVFKPVQPRNMRTKIMAFVGSPGVGKTTTLAKIGAIYSLFNSFNIAFITIDTFRVGAMEQMKIYGDIIGASVDIVMSPDELREAIARNSDKDLILIDTTGRPSKNTYQLEELKVFLDVLDFVEIYLVINATTQKRDMLQIIKDYELIAYSQIIISKVDETIAPGSIVNAAYYTGLPIAYITNGQDVPDDIEVANPKLLASYVMRDVVF
jgi:Flagellar GTP-binding protein